MPGEIFKARKKIDPEILSLAEDNLVTSFDLREVSQNKQTRLICHLSFNDLSINLQDNCLKGKKVFCSAFFA